MQFVAIVHQNLELLTPRFLSLKFLNLIVMLQTPEFFGRD